VPSCSGTGARRSHIVVNLAARLLACQVRDMVARVAIEPAFTFEANAICVHYSRKQSVD